MSGLHMAVMVDALRAARNFHLGNGVWLYRCGDGWEVRGGPCSLDDACDEARRLGADLHTVDTVRAALRLAWGSEGVA